jgi:type I restriction enzyme S subunit
VPILGSFGITGWHDVVRARGPGVTVGRSGASFGVVSYSPTDYWPLNTALYVVDFHGNDERFAYYFLKRFDFKGFNSGSAQPSLNRNFVHPVPVDVPPLEEQRAIAHILGTLDDKIELNRRMSETLEAMARALFKSWFVDFDPVRAKIEGRWQRGQSLPGLPAHLYDLFPARLVPSELGEIPEGWEVRILGDVAANPRRGIQPNRIQPDTPYIALEHMPKRRIALSDWGVADSLESNKFEFKKGEILFGKLRPYFHKVGVAPIDGVCSTDIVVVAPKSTDWFCFVLGHGSSVEFVEYTNAGSTGTKMPRTSWAEMSRYPIALPPQAVAHVFTERLQPFVDRIIAGIHESRTLAALRDALLPKLISGEIRVKDAKRFLTERGL